MAEVAVYPWVSLQPSVGEVVDDVEGGIVSDESVWLSAYACVPDAESVHDDVRLRHAAPGQAQLASAAQRLRVSCDAHAPRVWTVSGPSILTMPQHRVRIPCRAATDPWASDGAKTTAMALGVDDQGVERYMVGTTQGTLYYGTWGATSPLEAVCVPAHKSEVTSVHLFPSGQVALSTALDGQARIVSALDGHQPRVLVGHTRRINAGAILGRGREVATGSSDGSVRVWDVSRGETVDTWPTASPVNALVTSGASASVPDARVGCLVAGLDDGTLCQWDVRTPSASATSHALPSTPLATASQLSPAIDVVAADGPWVLGGTRHGVVAVYDVRQMSAPVKAWCRNTASVTCARMTGPCIYVGTSDGVPYQVDVAGDSLEELAGWDADPIVGIDVDAAGHAVVVGDGRWAVYGEARSR